MRWDFEKHPVNDTGELLWQIEIRAGRHRVPQLKENPLSVSGEATEAVGRVALRSFHGGSSEMATPPEKILIRREGEL